MTAFAALLNPVLRRPADDAALRDAERELGFPLPPAFAAVLRESNGLIDDLGCLLYATDEIGERNRTYAVSRYAPGHVGIGDNSGGQMVLLERDGTDPAVYVTDMGDMDASHFQAVADSLEAWLEAGAPFVPPGNRDDGLGDLIDVYLVRMPSNGLRGLSQIRQALRLSMPIGELKRLAASLPVPLIRGQTRVAYQKRVAILGEAAGALQGRPHSGSEKGACTVRPRR